MTELDLFTEFVNSYPTRVKCAKALRYTQCHLYQMLSGEHAITVECAARIEAIVGGGVMYDLSPFLRELRAER